MGGGALKRPAFQFYPADWRKDMALHSCSVSARGLWIDMMCIAHECDPYGHLTVNGTPMSAAQIGRHSGLTERECAKLLAELERAGVLSRTQEGAIYSRRMVADEGLRNRRADGGKAGSEHGHKGAHHGIKGGRPKAPRGVKEPPLQPPPSSSSSDTLAKANAATSAAPTAADSIFALGIPLITAAGVSEQRARSMLGLMRKTHGDDAVAGAISRCASEQPVEPVAWMQAALKTGQPKHVNGREHEPEWRREQREAMEAIAGRFAVKRATTNTQQEFIDAPSRLVG